MTQAEIDAAEEHARSIMREVIAGKLSFLGAMPSLEALFAVLQRAGRPTSGYEVLTEESLRKAVGEVRRLDAPQNAFGGPGEPD